MLDHWYLVTAIIAAITASVIGIAYFGVSVWRGVRKIVVKADRHEQDHDDMKEWRSQVTIALGDITAAITPNGGNTDSAGDILLRLDRCRHDTTAQCQNYKPVTVTTAKPRTRKPKEPAA